MFVLSYSDDCHYIPSGKHQASQYFIFILLPQLGELMNKTHLRVLTQLWRGHRIQLN